MRHRGPFYFSVLQIMRLFAQIFLACFLASGSVLAAGSSPPGAEVQSEALQAQALTQALVAVKSRYQKLGANDGGELLGQLTELAAARQELLASLIGTAPGEVLKTALPGGISTGMPAAVQAFLEQRLELEGTLRIFHVDDEDPSQSRYVYVLETLFGENFSLHFAANPPGLSSGTPVIVSGLLFDGVLAEDFIETDGAVVLESGDTSLENLAADGATTNATAEGAATLQLQHTFGEQRTAVFVVNFQDNPGDKPWTIAQVQDLVFGQTNDFFLENSFGQTWLAGNVLGWYTIPMDSTVCDLFGLANLAGQAASGAGVDLSVYDRFVYLFPKNGCGGSGTAQVNEFPSKTWIIGSFKLRTFAHELAHNLGLNHSHALDCGNTTLGSDCVSIGYGNTMDVLGYPRTVGHFNAFQKERLGWLNYDVSPPIATVATSGTYTIEPFETDGTNPRALKILKSEDPTTGVRTWYYLEYRQPIGFDAQIPTTGPAVPENVFNGLAVTQGTGSSGNSSYLLDMTPGSDFIDHSDAALVVGQSYTDAAAGVTITTQWADAGGIDVSVDLGPATCAQANPDLALAPSTIWADPGTSVTYTVTATNNDNTYCADVTFDLSASVPAGWTAAFAAASLTLAPGASGVTTLDITSPISAADGFYDATVKVDNTGDPAFTASVTATYVVSAPVNQPPVAGDDGSSTSEDTSVVIPVLANDIDPDGDPLTITAIIESGNGTCQDNGNGTLTYMPNPGFTGTDIFTYTVSDGNGGSDTASVTVSVAAVNDAPIANDDSATTSEDTAVSINVVQNDSDLDGDPLTVTSASQGANGSVAITSASSVTYTPNGGFAGTDSFTYSITDGNGGSDTASVTVNVAAVNGEPVANDDSTSTDEGVAVNVNVVQNDSDPDGDPLTVTSVSQGANGSVAITSASSVTYAPNGGFAGTDSFTYSIADGNGGSDIAVVTVTVGTVNQPPDAVDDSETTTENTAVIFNVLANDNDPEGDSLIVVSVNQGAKGTVTFNVDGTVTYVPHRKSKGQDSFGYTIKDSAGNIASAMVSVMVKNAKAGGGKKGNGK